MEIVTGYERHVMNMKEIDEFYDGYNTYYSHIKSMFKSFIYLYNRELYDSWWLPLDDEVCGLNLVPMDLEWIENPNRVNFTYWFSVNKGKRDDKMQGSSLCPATMSPWKFTSTSHKKLEMENYIQIYDSKFGSKLSWHSTRDTRRILKNFEYYLDHKEYGIEREMIERSISFGQIERSKSVVSPHSVALEEELYRILDCPTVDMNTDILCKYKTIYIGDMIFTICKMGKIIYDILINGMSFSDCNFQLSQSILSWSGLTGLLTKYDKLYNSIII
jgi:hypothetical protein